MMYLDKHRIISNYYEEKLTEELRKHKLPIPTLAKKMHEKIFSYECWAVETLLNRCINNPERDPVDIIDEFEMELYGDISTSKNKKMRNQFEDARNEIMYVKTLLEEE